VFFQGVLESLQRERERERERERVRERERERGGGFRRLPAPGQVPHGLKAAIKGLWSRATHRITAVSPRCEVRAAVEGVVVQVPFRSICL